MNLILINQMRHISRDSTQVAKIHYLTSITEEKLQDLEISKEDENITTVIRPKHSSANDWMRLAPNLAPAKPQYSQSR